MRRTVIQLTLVLLLAIGLFGPIFQDIDPWDSFPDTGDNGILVLAMAAMWLGLTLCLALLIPLLFAKARPLCRALVVERRRDPGYRLRHSSGCFESPSPLRI